MSSSMREANLGMGVATLHSNFLCRYLSCTGVCAPLPCAAVDSATVLIVIEDSSSERADQLQCAQTASPNSLGLCCAGASAQSAGAAMGD